MAITNPVINKVFNDLDAYRDFCRFEGSGRVFNENALYNRRDRNWQDYENFVSGTKRKPYVNNKPKRTFQK